MAVNFFIIAAGLSLSLVSAAYAFKLIANAAEHYLEP